ncbi:MAG: hypothetical protein E7212_12700 [Clostridium sartagoforme]|nr:hypothetical protein [Clostridium sartagoforme]
MKIVRKLMDIINDNFKIKLGICLMLVGVLIFVVILGSIYSSNLNTKNLAVKVTKSQKVDAYEKSEENKKEIEEEKLKKSKLDEIKNKIKELDQSINLEVTMGSIDNDIKYYDEMYMKLLAIKEESEDTNDENEIIENDTEYYVPPVVIENNSTQNSQEPTNPANSNEVPNIQVEDKPVEDNPTEREEEKEPTEVEEDIKPTEENPVEPQEEEAGVGTSIESSNSD